MVSRRQQMAEWLEISLQRTGFAQFADDRKWFEEILKFLNKFSTWDEIRCANCETPEPAMFMLKDELWNQIKPDDTPGGGTLCIACAQTRLGRKIKFTDLKSCNVTNDILLGGLIEYKFHALGELTLAVQGIGSDEIKELYGSL